MKSTFKDSEPLQKMGFHLSNIISAGFDLSFVSMLWTAAVQGSITPRNRSDHYWGKFRLAENKAFLIMLTVLKFIIKPYYFVMSQCMRTLNNAEGICSMDFFRRNFNIDLH